jgi:hypothetical protein
LEWGVNRGLQRQRGAWPPAVGESEEPVAGAGYRGEEKAEGTGDHRLAGVGDWRRERSNIEGAEAHRGTSVDSGLRQAVYREVLAGGGEVPSRDQEGVGVLTQHRKIQHGSGRKRAAAEREPVDAPGATGVGTVAGRDPHGGCCGIGGGNHCHGETEALVDVVELHARIGQAVSGSEERFECHAPATQDGAGRVCDLDETIDQLDDLALTKTRAWPADRLVESRGLGRGPHRGDLRNLRARDSLT